MTAPRWSGRSATRRPWPPRPPPWPPRPVEDRPAGAGGRAAREGRAGPGGALRSGLDDHAVDRYGAVAADTVAAVDAACATLAPATTETEAAGAVLGACRAAGLFAPALMVAGAARLPRHRHPVPTAAPLGARAMVVVCAERGGLYANLTRFV